METHNADSAPEAHRRLENLPVLIVEDDAPSAKLLGILLAGEGCDVEVARSAEEALAILRTFQPKVIILDLILPLMGGVLLAERLKSHPMTRDVILVAVTAFNGPEMERVARAAGCTSYIPKPIDPISFAKVIDHLVGSVERP